MCNCNQDAAASQHPADPESAAGGMSRRSLLGAVTASAAGITAGALLGPGMPAYAATGVRSRAPLRLTLLGTSGGPPPLATRFGISSALVVNGKTYIVDCGRGAVSQYMRAGLSMPSLTSIFLTHLHADHIVDYFSFPLLSGGVQGSQGFQNPIDVYGPAASGLITPVTGAPSPGTATMTGLLNDAFAASTGFFLAEHFGVNPVTLLRVHDVAPPAASGASPSNPAPTTMAPFKVMEDDNVVVTAILVPHGAVFPAYAYRFDTEYGSVVFSGDTALTPNIPRLAHRADVLVHEGADFDSLARIGQPPAVIKHIETVHTGVKDLGQVAATSEVGSLVLSHLVPSNPAFVSDAHWRRLLRESAHRANYHGKMILGEDLLTLPVSRRRCRPAGR